MKFFKIMIKKSDGLSRLYRGVRDQLDRNKPLKETPWGFKLSGHDRMAAGSFEEIETELVREILGETDLFVNVGANIGYYICHALSLEKEVVAVEPIQRNVHYLMKNAHANGWNRQVEIYPLAAGEKQDILPIWGGGTAASLVKGWAMNPDNYVNFVPVQTLDRILTGKAANRKLFILVDIEGFEYPLLKGAKMLLQNDPKPIWMVEITKTEHQPDEAGNPWFVKTFRTFFDAGYRAFSGDRSQREVFMDEVIAIDEGKQQSSCINYIFRDKYGTG